MSDKFEFIDVEYAAYRESDEQYVPSIVKMCIWMEVSRSGFYGWRDKPESATAKKEKAELDAAMLNLQRQKKLLAMGSGRKAEVNRAQEKVSALQQKN